jgi:predicted O-methyltransferase YrrM
MSVRTKLHRVKVRLNLSRALASEGISDIKQRHSDFDLIRNRVRESGTDNLTHFGNGYTHEGGLYLQQNADEFAALTLFLRERGPHLNYLEIGSASGGACFFLYRELGFRSVISIDDGGHPRAAAQAEHFAQISNFKQFLGDSHTGNARRFLEQNVEGKLDVAFIDGDHSFEGVWQDIELTRPFCRVGALMILHDTVACEGVNRAWRKCIQRNVLRPLAEFVGEEKPLGIGVGSVI